jgi:DNA-binding HxlR family transcriptional regulator
MVIPRIGAKVRGSSTGRPIMVVLDLLGRRAALRILWELRTDQLTFRALQDACDTNPSVLNTRLAELRAAELVDHAAGGYLLTAQGRKLMAAFRPLSVWAANWLPEEARPDASSARNKPARQRRNDKAPKRGGGSS